MVIAAALLVMESAMAVIIGGAMAYGIPWWVHFQRSYRQGLKPPNSSS